MTLDLLKQNISHESEIVREILELKYKKDEMEQTAVSGVQIDSTKKKAIETSLKELISQFKTINNAIPDLVNGISFYPNLAGKEEKKPSELVNIKYQDETKNQEVNIVIKKKEHDKFLESLGVHNLMKKRLQVQKVQDSKSTVSNIDKFSSYIRLSNKLFRNLANGLVASGSFDHLKIDLIKITSPLLLNSYLAIMLFSCMISFFVGVIVALIAILSGLDIIISILIPFIMPFILLILFYIYPSSKRKSLEKEINQELPFLIIYMSAIATSGIEPSKIFQIVVGSKDYPVTRREVKKLTNYINFYGYDLVSGLKAVAKTCPSERMAQLFDGLATTITSGGELTAFLNKHSESLLFDYRLEREKYTRTAETFMNIYISVVIAAPMIMMMIFILMSLGGFAQGYLNPTSIGVVTILTISFLNMAFLLFLNVKQPKF
jgi:Flp pilus assembly protein TadB